MSGNDIGEENEKTEVNQNENQSCNHVWEL